MDTKKKLCKIGAAMKDAGLVAGCDGNISFRSPDGSIIITPSGVPKGRLKASQLLVLDAEGKVKKGKGKPSSETALHLEIYKARPDVCAIIHAHPTVATAVTVAGLSFPAGIVTEGALVLGEVPTVPYAAPGSRELALACAAYAKKANVFLMERHGATAVGKDLKEALNRMETLEAVAKIYRAALAFSVNSRALKEMSRTEELAALFWR